MSHVKNHNEKVVIKTPVRHRLPSGRRCQTGSGSFLGAKPIQSALAAVRIASSAPVENMEERNQETVACFKATGRNTFDLRLLDSNIHFACSSPLVSQKTIACPWGSSRRHSVTALHFRSKITRWPTLASQFTSRLYCQGSIACRHCCLQCPLAQEALEGKKTQA